MESQATARSLLLESRSQEGTRCLRSDLPGPPPLPPADLGARPLPLLTVPAGTTLHRIHSSRFDALYFGRTGNNRFDAPEAQYGVCYLGRDTAACFAETFLRAVGRPFVTEIELAKRSISAITTTRTLRLVEVYGSGLAKLGATSFVASGTYDISQAWSLALWSHPDKPHGLLYRSRHDDSRLCLALFCRSADTLQVSATAPLIDPLDPLSCGRLADLLERYAVQLG